MATISYLQLNARDLVPAIAQINDHSGLVYGFEVVEKSVVDILQYNIDPQHTGFKWMGKSDKPENISASLKMLNLILEGEHLPPVGDELVVMSTKPDIDSVGAAALFVNTGVISLWINDPRKHDTFHKLCERVKSIDKVDCGLGNIDGSQWNPDYYKQNLIKQVSEFNILGAMCGDFRLSLDQKIYNMFVWLTTGELAHLIRYADQVTEEFLAQKDSEITLDPVPLVESTARGATGILYSVSPYGVAFNHSFPTKDGTIRKFTVCEFTSGKYLNLQGILDDISQIEKGWGGNLGAGIIGSPFAGTELSVGEVCAIVARHIKPQTYQPQTPEEWEYEEQIGQFL